MTVRDHGVQGLYRGLSVLLYGSIPKSAVRCVANSVSFDNKYETRLSDSIITIESQLYAPFPFGKCRWPYKGGYTVFHDLLLWSQ